MEKKSIILCDTDVLIEFYRNNQTVINNLRRIGQANIAISIAIVGEILFGAFNKKELTKLKKDLQHLNILHINQEIGETFLNLMLDYTLNHKLKVPDGLIAATAIGENIPLYTHNLKDFNYIKGIKIFEEVKIL
jgi:tRNA(fMet)-specific endonuclease VapC